MASIISRFNPYFHIPVTDEDRQEIEFALWQGWELMVDDRTGDVWIGSRENKIASVVSAAHF